MTRDQLAATGGRDAHTVRFAVGTSPAQVDVLSASRLTECRPQPSLAPDARRDAP